MLRATIVHTAHIVIDLFIRSQSDVNTRQWGKVEDIKKFLLFFFPLLAKVSSRHKLMVTVYEEKKKQFNVLEERLLEVSMNFFVRECSSALDKWWTLLPVPFSPTTIHVEFRLRPLAIKHASVRIRARYIEMGAPYFRRPTFQTLFPNSECKVNPEYFLEP